MTKMLITGGAGFIGSNFVKHMLNKYPLYHIVNLDALRLGSLENLKSVENNDHYQFIKGDICDESVVESAMQGCDVVVNFAAETHVDRANKDASSFIRTNVCGTQVLLEAAKNNSIKKFIQISTDEVYGSIEEGCFKEDANLRPNNPYAASKAGGDLLVRSYGITHKLPTIIIRSVNNFGPFQYPEKIIPLFIANLLDNQKVPVYGDGLYTRNWIYVMDACEAIDKILHHGGVGEIYNVSADFEILNLELTKKLLALLGKSEEDIAFVEDRKGHDRRYALDAEKLKKLGWESRFDFDKALEQTVNWYKENRDWLKK